MKIPPKEFEIKVAFIGNVSAGKTTVINALFRDQFGEVSMKRTTAGVNEFAICISTEWALASDKEPREPKSILKEITEDNAALRKNNKMAVKRFEVELKEEVCEMRKDTRLVIVDIPGINEAGASNKYRDYVEEKWNTFDCVVVVMDGRQGVNTEEQVSLLHFIKQNDNKREMPLLILFNKVDDPDDDEQAELVVEAREYVKNMFEAQDSEKNDEKSPESENPANASTWFIPISGITAFIFRCCSNMSFERFRCFDEKLIAKLGREHVGKLKWRKLSEEEKFVQAHTAVTDPNGYQQGIEESNFNSFMKTLSVVLGAEFSQFHLIKKQIDESMELLPASSGLVDKLDLILNQLTKLDPDESNHRESLSSVFWRNYKKFENESFDQLLSSPTAIDVLAPLADELIAYHQLAGKTLWKDEQASVYESLKGLVQRQISTILEKDTETISKWVWAPFRKYPGWENLSPSDWDTIFSSIQLLLYDKRFCEEFGRELVCIDRLKRQRWREWSAPSEVNFDCEVISCPRCTVALDLNRWCGTCRWFVRPGPAQALTSCPIRRCSCSLSADGSCPNCGIRFFQTPPLPEDDLPVSPPCSCGGDVDYNRFCSVCSTMCYRDSGRKKCYRHKRSFVFDNCNCCECYHLNCNVPGSIRHFHPLKTQYKNGSMIAVSGDKVLRAYFRLNIPTSMADPNHFGYLARKYCDFLASQSKCDVDVTIV